MITALGTSFLPSDLGVHIVRMPMICSSANNMVIASKTCVIPPVGIGSAGMDISNKKEIAKLFSAKTSFIADRVFGLSLFSHKSSL